MPDPIRVVLAVPPRRGGPRPWAEALLAGLAPEADLALVHGIGQAGRLVLGRRDLVHTTVPFVRSRRPLVATLHGNFRVEARVYRRPYERLLACADAITTTSPYLRDALELDERAHVIPAAMADPGPVWTARRDGKPEDVRALVAANFSFEQKTRGVTELLDAIGRLPAASRPASVDVCGGGMYEDRVISAVERAGPGVRFLGWRADLRARFADYDVLLYASHLDNQPMLLLEAALAGLPIVSTPIGDVPQMLDVRSMLHSWDELAPKLAAARDPGWLEDLSRANRTKVLARHGWPAVKPAWLSLYRSLVE
ncbi:MAG TPA: glycosyltransferase family 4 protein [Candidatus Thermoplasmatota archaeon]|nr:glycosyltransferase family 4 protein [Candidatus Thermoplasmatota archaeon]